VQFGNASVTVGTFPIGINADTFIDAFKDIEVDEFSQNFLDFLAFLTFSRVELVYSLNF
jgi:hypothetical protein